MEEEESCYDQIGKNNGCQQNHILWPKWFLSNLVFFPFTHQDGDSLMVGGGHWTEWTQWTQWTEWTVDSGRLLLWPQCSSFLPQLFYRWMMAYSDFHDRAFPPFSSCLVGQHPPHLS